jgi:hypothetical protein
MKPVKGAAMSEQADEDRKGGWCYECERPKDSTCDGCGEPVCVVCDGAYCWKCRERMEKGD